MYIGCHLSVAKGYAAMGDAALMIGANTFQYFSRNPRGGRARTVDTADIERLLATCKQHAFGPLIVHAPYTLNACAADERVRTFAKLCIAEDLAAIERIPNSLYNLHPGSHVGQGTQQGIERTAALLNEAILPTQTSTLLIETMSGQGSEIGVTFEEIAEILARVELQEHIGVCMDTCHVFAAGYDIVNDLDGVLTQFDKTIGLNRLKALHINDSLQPMGSHRDRHARLGEGMIDLPAIQRIVHHPSLKTLPMILETPNEAEGYAREIQLLRKLDVSTPAST